MTAYQKRLTSDDEALSLEAARRWSVWETSTARLIPNAEDISKAETDDRWARYVSSTSSQLRALIGRAFARIENHYFVNKVRRMALCRDDANARRVSSQKMDT